MGNKYGKMTTCWGFHSLYSICTTGTKDGAPHFVMTSADVVGFLFRRKEVLVPSEKYVPPPPFDPVFLPVQTTSIAFIILQCMFSGNPST